MKNILPGNGSPSDYEDFEPDGTNPIEFILIKKVEILFRLENEEAHTKKEALSQFNFITAIIHKLEEMRLCIHKTCHYLEETLIKPVIRNKNFIINFLVKATIGSESYQHSYNFLINIVNRDHPIPLKPKELPEHVLVAIVLKERSAGKSKKHKAVPVKLSLNQVALKCVWEEITITWENKDAIAAGFGYKSGHKLYQNYNFWSKKSNRTADPDGTPTLLRNKIRLFESVIELLPDSKREKALDELKILQDKLANHFL